MQGRRKCCPKSKALRGLRAGSWVPWGCWGGGHSGGRDWVTVAGATGDKLVTCWMLLGTSWQPPQPPPRTPGSVPCACSPPWAPRWRGDTYQFALAPLADPAEDDGDTKADGDDG